MKTNREKEVVRKIVREILLQENFSRSALVEDKTDSSSSDASDPLSYLSAPDEKFYTDISKATEPIGFTSANLPPVSFGITEYAIDKDKKLVPSGIEGVMMKPDVKMNLPIENFIKKMRENLYAGIPITITSGTRTPTEQAAAMFQKHLSAGGGGRGGPGYREIKNVYREGMADLLYSVQPSVDKWLVLLQRRVERGGKKLPHERGQGIDIRTRGLRSDQVEDLVKAARDAGGDPLIETKPPHLHVTIGISGDGDAGC